MNVEKKRDSTTVYMYIENYSKYILLQLNFSKILCLLITLVNVY